ncbi:Flp pilus assembly protein TadG [Bryocella elongata]|uniref:Flp pilus assembly protein TadG n=1 Tax=Bryocella elongata TaxID=863522 RepID=A0A1H6A2S6_9BACT|nr:TadE/TadG family type IV pilus assembly protein [Bryocella elongata]SEG42524.1 Flp pilus assembly protein TadG [Bryocella elongata]
MTQTIHGSVRACICFATDTAGNASIDIAISMSLFLMALFGIVDCSRLAYIDHFLATAASSASRYAMVRGSTWNGASCTNTINGGCTATSTDVATFVKALDVTGISSNKLTVTTTWPGTGPTGLACGTAFGTNGPGCVVNVSVTYAFNFALPFLPTGTMNLHSSASETIVQ